MKRHSRLLFVSSVLVAGAVACVDLFHDTDGLVAPCANDACRDGDSPASDGQVAPTGLRCSSDPGAALGQAQSACAWLGACAGPFGVNEPGRCLLEALRAFDCKLDPNNPPRAQRAEFWGCMQSASSSSSCESVRRCVFPRADHRCNSKSEVFACPDLGAGAGDDRFVRVLCTPDASVPKAGENCAAAGGQCVSLGTGLAYQGCSTLIPAAEAPDCTKSSCQSGETLSVCTESSGGLELSRLDCTLSGSGRCGSGDDAGPGCLAETPPDAGCQPESAVTCRGGVASRCRNRAYEEVDCARAGLGCDATEAELTHEACRAEPSDAGDADAPCVARCVEGKVHACLRGRETILDCAAHGLGACRSEQGTDVTAPACGAPKTDAGK